MTEETTHFVRPAMHTTFTLTSLDICPTHSFIRGFLYSFPKGMLTLVTEKSKYTLKTQNSSIQENITSYVQLH